jgi:NADPH:quinone reductase
MRARLLYWASNQSGPLQALAPDALVAKSLSFSRPVVFDYVASQGQLAERAQRVWAALADGAIKSPTIERFTLEAAAKAHARLESRATIGALVLLP